MPGKGSNYDRVLMAIKDLIGASNAWASMSPVQRISQRCGLPSAIVLKLLDELEAERVILRINDSRVVVILLAERLKN
jgi:DNA-binding MarR family transcriptional regulator